MSDRKPHGGSRKWLRWTLSLFGLAGALLSGATVATSDVKNAQASLDSRVLAARELLQRDRAADATIDGPSTKLAQWWNWPNWNNWGNWPNWNNWYNWWNR